ncbi:hypothetical protein L208DRAFT_1380175 [Tricholoma matsutake]|nr:hypothetical protein L208DRAFT_1380175 [Tricholoma matsutake 945]
MAKHGWKMYGMRMVIFEGHYNKHEEAIYAIHTEAEGAALAGVSRRLPTGLVSQKAHAWLPWLNISDQQEEFLSADYVPEHFTIWEPSRLKDDPKVAHTFLWMAHLVGAKMIPHHYVILDSEPSGSTAQKKPRKKTKEHKGKGKVVSAVAGSGNKSDDTTGKMITWQKKVTWEADGLTLSASNCRSENPVHGAAKGVANSKSLEYGNEEMVVDWPTLYKQEAEQKHRISKKVIKSVIDAEDMEESGGVVGVGDGARKDPYDKPSSSTDDDGT